MSIATLVLGESGTGKSCSMRNMNPSTTLLIQCQSKPLPFKSLEWKAFATNQAAQICKFLQAARSRGKTAVVIDDFQYLMSHEYMMRAQETGFNKFTEIGLNAYNVIQQAIHCEPDLRVYIMSHVESSDTGKVKIKTIGKMLDEKITLEGLFTIVLRTHVEGGQYSFSTQNNGQDTVKSPMGMFDSTTIDNDLDMVDSAICDYYGITK